MKAQVIPAQFYLRQYSEYMTLSVYHMDKFKVNSIISSELHTYNHSSFCYSEPAMAMVPKFYFTDVLQS